MTDWHNIRKLPSSAFYVDSSLKRTGPVNRSQQTAVDRHGDLRKDDGAHYFKAKMFL
jgi:hypothetical protein